jgi:membrane protein
LIVRAEFHAPSVAPSVWTLLKFFSMARRKRCDRRNDREARPRPPAISPAEYWTYLAATGLLAVLLANQRFRSQRFHSQRFRSVGPRSENASPGVGDSLHVQQMRAAEQGRGRHAEAPWQISWLGWKDILWRTYRQIGENRLLALAAGVVFYGLLALFPALAGFVSLYGLFAKTSSISDQLSLVAGVFPDGVIDIIRDQIARLISKGDAKLSVNFIAAFCIALWSANAGTEAIIDALNVIYEEKEKRGFIRLNLISLGFTLGAIVALTLALTGIILLPHLLDDFGLDRVSAIILRTARWPTLLLVTILGLSVIYRFGPSRREPQWQWVSIGSIAASIVALATSSLLSWYFAHLANYDATYGSLGAVIGTMLWLWILWVVVLLGAQINSEIEHQTAKDSTVGRPKPLGQRGATMADTIGQRA